MDDMAEWTLSGDDADAFTIPAVCSAAPPTTKPNGRRRQRLQHLHGHRHGQAGGEMEMMAVTVTVDNAEEAGTVTLDPMRPSVGTAITATLADADIVETVSWQWASADAMDGTFTNITGATDATYTPVAADADMWLRAMATYTDGFTPVISPWPSA